MFADKTLLLKGLAGVAAVGAAGSGTFIFRKELGLVDSSNNESADVNQNSTQESDPKVQAQNIDQQQRKDSNGDQHAGGGDGATVEGSSQPSDEEIAKQKEEKKSKVNEQLTKLGLESGCHLDITNFSSPTEFSKECELDQAKLQKIPFSNKGETDVTVTGLDGNIKLKIANKQGSEDAISYTFKEIKTKLTISGSSEKPYITLKNDEEKEFEDKDGKLTKVSASPSDSTKIAALNQKLKNLKVPNRCWFEEGENEGSIECTLNKTELQKIPFSNKGTADVTVEGLTDGGSINLKIEKKDNNKLSYKFSGASSKLTISGDPTKPNITLKPNEEREFEEKDGNKLGKVSASSSDSTKIAALNQKLKTLKIPNRCWFEEGEGEESIDCDLSKEEDLKKIEFLNKESGKDSRIEGSINGLKLTINRLNGEEGSKKYKSGIDLEFIFRGYSSEIKIKDNRTDASSATSDIILVPNTNSPFTITDSSSSHANRLYKYFASGTIDSKLNLSCTGSAPNINCTPFPEDKKIKVLNSADGNVEEITIKKSETNTTILKTAENTANYELGIKFTVIQDYPSSSPKLTKNSTYEAKYIKDKGGWLLSKKT